MTLLPPYQLAEGGLSGVEPPSICKKGNKIMDSVAEILRLRRLNEEAASYSVNKVNESKFEVIKDGQVAYTLTKKQSRWQCSCTGYQYRGQCKHLDMIKPFMPKRHDRAVITNAVKDILPKLKQITPRVEIVGSYRRGSKDSKDIDILMDCSAAQFKKVVEVLESYQNYKPVMAGDNIIRGHCDGIEMDINRLSEGMNYYLALEYRTGPADHNIAMRQLAKKMNGSLSENELVVNGRNIRVTSEQDIYAALGVVYQEPRNRSDRLEFVMPKNPGAYRTQYKGRILGSAPSRSYAKQQIKDIRQLCKDIPKLIEKDLKGIELGKMSMLDAKIDLRFTVSEAEEKSTDCRYEVVTPQGDEVPTYNYKLGIKPVLKVDGVRVKMGDRVTIKGKSVMLYEFMMEKVQDLIDKRMKLPTHETGKLCSNELRKDGLPELLVFKTVSFPVESLKG